MSRLLHAAARGARIEVLYQRVWIPLTHISLTLNPYTYRIHPDDAHLAYGPVSTALREMSEQFVYSSRWQNQLAITAANEFQFYIGGVHDDHSLFYLFLAEFLADEGM